MSFANLRRAPQPAEHYGRLQDAMASVAESSFFAFTDPCDAATFREMAAPLSPWLEGGVAFDGTFSGRMTCTVPESLARELFASFIGLEPGEAMAEAPLFDLMGEFANMVGGAWLTHVSERRHFDLLPPTVVRVAEAPSYQDPDGLPLLVNGVPVLIQVTFNGR